MLMLMIFWWFPESRKERVSGVCTYLASELGSRISGVPLVRQSQLTVAAEVLSVSRGVCHSDEYSAPILPFGFKTKNKNK